MKQLSLSLLILISVFSCDFSSETETKSLFNRVDLSGWHADIPAMDENPDTASAFIIRDSMLVSLGNPGGHLITDSVFMNYRLELEYRFAGKPGNCGVLVHASTPRALYEMFPKSLEVQMQYEHAGDFWCIVEDISVPDMENRRGPEEEWGITEGKKRRILNLTDGSENPLGSWNTMVIESVENEIKVWVNDDLVNYGFDCTTNKGQIAIQAEGSEVEFRKIEITPITALTETDNYIHKPVQRKEEIADGFIPLFNGKDLTGWTGENHSYQVEDGNIVIHPVEGGGNLYTEKEYSDFIFRFEFKLTPGANNGLGIRTPMEGDAAYAGYELQILDNTAPVYDTLKPYQYHGSVYGIIPAKRGYLKPVGEWNSQEVYMKGDKIRITLNGTIIVDGDLKEASKNGTPDHREHPGLSRTSGHIGFLGHGSEVWFRNIRIKEL